ncbi:hypothetical protein AAC387_Pa03g4671 [Persea americana]
MNQAKMRRWQAWFSEWNFKVEHVKGIENSLPDALTREMIFMMQEMKGRKEKGKMTQDEQNAQVIYGYTNTIWNAIAGLQEERPCPNMPEKLAIDSLKNSVRLVEHNFTFTPQKANKYLKREQREATFDNFSSITLSESEIISTHSDKTVRMQLEKYLQELPSEIVTNIFKKVTTDEAAWYSLFLGVQCITIQTRLPGWGGFGTYCDKRFTALDVLMHKMLPSEFGELFEAGIIQRTNFVKTEKYYNFLPICIHRALALWFTKNPSAKTVVADITSVIPEWEEIENDQGDKEVFYYPSYHYIELKRRDEELSVLRPAEKIPEWITDDEEAIRIRLTLQDIRAQQFWNLSQILSRNLTIIGGDERILVSYKDKEGQFENQSHLLQQLRTALLEQKIMASDFVKIESMLDANPDPDLGPCLENNEDGNDFFNDLDSTGWENYENQLDR